MNRYDVEFVGPSKDLLAFGAEIDETLSRILGRHCHFALAIALDNKPNMSITRISNSSISDARILFELASLVPVSLDTYAIRDWAEKDKAT